jgi:LmbE family N-acetylglucosaminyl deacetylase
MKVLFFAPHPDDLEFFTGGTALSHVRKGDEVVEILLSCGENQITKMVNKEKLVEIRKREAFNSAQALGIKILRFLDFQAKKIFYTPESVLKIKKVIREFLPERIYAPSFKHRIDFWIGDHPRSGRLIFEAIKDLKFRTELFLYGSIKPNSFVDISKYFNKINQALSLHRSQQHILRTFNFLRMYFLKKWGKRIGVDFAEGFERYLIQ